MVWRQFMVLKNKNQILVLSQLASKSKAINYLYSDIVYEHLVATSKTKLY